MNGIEHLIETPIEKQIDEWIDILSSFDFDGEFAIEGWLSLNHIPSFYVHNQLIRLPIEKEELKFIESKSELAPYGLKEDTIFDLKVRNTLQIDSKFVKIKNQEFWDKFILKKIKNDIVSRFKLTKQAKFRLELYKLLYYKTDGHFDLHRDTTKDKKMIGTCVIELPTLTGYKGGSIDVFHLDHKRSFCHDLQSQQDSISFIAFYADCLHKINKIEYGDRVCLVYNIVQDSKSKNSPHFIPSIEPCIGLLSKFFENFDLLQLKQVCENLVHANKKQKLHRPFLKPRFVLPLLYVLNHSITIDILDLDHLRGRDFWIGKMFENLIKMGSLPKDLNIHLGLVHFEVVTDCDKNYDESFVGNIIYSKSIFGQYHQNLKDMKIEIENILDFDNYLCDNAGDKQEHLSSGNEGGGVSQWYHRPVFIFWPNQSNDEIDAIKRVEYSHLNKS